MDTNLFPTAVDITLHKYNHFDNQLWTRIKNELDYIDVNENSVMVTVTDLGNLFDAYYLDEINQIKSVGAEFLHKKVTTQYFIYMMMVDMQNLQYVKFTRSMDKSFNRIIDIEGDKILKFDFKVLSMTINLYELFSPEDLKLVNPILESIGIFEEEVPYNRIKLSSLLDSLDAWVNQSISFEFDEDERDPLPLITAFIDIMDPKTERDDPIVLLVTDY